MVNKIHKIKWSESFWFFDIDDTLIDTAGINSKAAEGIKNVFRKRSSTIDAEKVNSEYINIFNYMLSGYRVKHDDEWSHITGGKEGFKKLISEIENCQIRIKDQFGHIKKWSREVFIKLAADRTNVRYSPETIHEAADAYWLTLTEKTIVFPHALKLIQEIKKHNRPIYLLTSSDARLKLASDGQFDYLPEYSEGLKRERIELLREKGIEFNLVSIGDPEDKPNLDFFQKGFMKAELDYGFKINLENAIMLGDSYAGDLQTPKEKMGFGLVVLMRKGKQTEIIDTHQVDTGNLAEIAEMLVE